ELVNDSLLPGRGFSQDRMQSGDNGRVQVPHERKDVAAVGSAKNPELMLNRDRLEVSEVQEVSSPPIRLGILLFYLEADLWRVFVTGVDVIDGGDNALGTGVLFRDCAAQVIRKRGNSTLSRNIVRNETDSTDLRLRRRVIGHAEGARLLP